MEEMYYYRYDPVRMKYSVHKIRVIHREKYKMRAEDVENPRHYWTRVHPEEGKVLNNGVWFTSPQFEEAARRLRVVAETNLQIRDAVLKRNRLSYLENMAQNS